MGGILTRRHDMMTLVSGSTFKAIGSRFPVAFKVVRVNPVKPEMTIRELVDGVPMDRIVKTTVLTHAARVRGIEVR